MRSVLVVVGLLPVVAALALAGTTGKIAGKVRDAETGEPLVGVSVVIEGTTMGASSTVDGDFTIANVPPGTYAVAVSGVGVQRKRYIDVKVSVDFTTRLDVQIATDVIALETVEVRAEAPMVRRDLTSTQTTVDAREIEALPVETVAQVLTLQAGVTQGADGALHIRGGRSTEIQYTVNGVSVVNPYDNSQSVTIATNAIQELSVVAGTFNAEYGNALSGIVNAVTKEGGPSYHGSLSFYAGDYLSGRTDAFPRVDDFYPWTLTVTEGTFSGPIPGVEDLFTVFLSGRYANDRGYLYGVRQHRPSDFVVRGLTGETESVVQTGDSADVSMNTGWNFTGTGKLTFAPAPTMKLRYDLVYSDRAAKSYNHDYKYNPDGNTTGYEFGLLNALDFRHSVSPSSYYTVKASWSLNDSERYLYELLDRAELESALASLRQQYPDLAADALYAMLDYASLARDYHAGLTLDTSVYALDPRYQPDWKRQVRAAPETFLSGGTLPGHFYQRTNSVGGRFDIVSQLTQQHEVKGGLEVRYHDIRLDEFTVLYDTLVYKVPTIPGEESPYHDSYLRTPIEFSAYLQDKMEFESIIVNAGLRFDYFDPRAMYSTDDIYPSPQTPGLPAGIDSASLLADAAGKSHWSPRIGVSFPITDRGIIHFSYGHFFQMPPFEYLYTNPQFEFFPNQQPTFGNANLEPEKTVTYEVGLQQQLADNFSFTLTGFYKDVRDLLALQQIRITTNQTYYKYVNKDYANIRGITVSMVKRRTGADLLGATVDYTYQVAEGNETNADAFFLDVSSGRQSEKVPVALDWDQRHTLNATVSLGRMNDWNVTAVARLGSGLPFTPENADRTVALRVNSDRRPSQLTVDLLADKTFRVSDDVTITAFAKVFNLFDALNERSVYTTTGRATYSLDETKGPAEATNDIASRVPGVHPASEYYRRPNYFAPPRQVRIGASVDF